MIKTFNVDNFKSLNNLSINLQPMTVIVGNNATGKSSILQAIDFVCGCVNDDFSVLLERRGWTVDNIRSKFIRSGEYSCAAEPPVRGGVSHLSRRNEPL